MVGLAVNVTTDPGSLKTAVTPSGNPLTENAMACVNPLVRMVTLAPLYKPCPRLKTGGCNNSAKGCGEIQIVVLPETEGFETLAAVIVTDCNAAMDAGAVYNPVLSIVPAPAGLIDQLTPAVPAFEDIAVNCCGWAA